MPGGTKGARKPTKLLKDMRYVFANQAPAVETAESQERRTLRRFLNENAQAFIAAMSKEEHLHRVRSAESVAAANKADEGSERSLEAIDELLAGVEGTKLSR